MNFKEFDPSQLKLPMSMIILAKSKSGKTEQLLRIIYALRKQIDDVFIFSKTIEINKNQFKMIPKQNQYDNLNLGKIEEIFEIQKANPKNKCMLILDDIVSDVKAMKTQAFQDLFILGRHFGISIILLSQVFNTAITPQIRQNCNYIISFYQSNYDRRLLFVKEYMSIKSVKEGVEAFNEITQEPYNSIVIDTLNREARSLEEYIQKYKVDLTEKIPKYMIENKKKNFLKKPSEMFGLKVFSFVDKF